MKRCCWIHVGMHKTGTTSIQGTLMAREPTDDWQYLALQGKANMGAPMFAMFSTRPRKSIWFKKAGRSVEEVTERGRVMRQELEEAIIKTSARNVLISGESISNIDREGCRAMKEFLSRFFDEIRIVGYVRPPRSYKVSLFQELIKHGNGKKWLHPVGYRRKFRNFDVVFGRENVMLRKFDPAKLRDGCAVADFCDFLGLPLPKPGEVRNLNERLCREACGILYTYRQLGPKPERGVGSGIGGMQANWMIVSALIAMKGTPFIVADSVLADSLNGELVDIRWMEERLGESLDEKGSSAGDKGIASVEELYQISGETCQQFATRLRELHGVEVPASEIPQGSIVDPAEAAKFVERCRTLCRDLIAGDEKRVAKATANGAGKRGERKAKNKKPEKVAVRRGRFWKWIARKFSRTRATQRTGSSA